jgi:predicted esterase
MIYRIKEYGRQHAKVIFLLGGWKTKQWLYILPAILLSRRGCRCIVYTYDKSVLSPDVERTNRSLHAIRDAVLAHIAELKTQGATSFALFGFSLGTMLACMIANKSSDIKKIVLNTVGASLAATVWSWDDTMPGFKKALQSQGYTLEKLEDSWHDLAPANNLTNLNHVQILIYLAQHDQVIPYTLGRQFVTALQRKKLPHKLIINRWGSHSVAGAYNILNIGRYDQFLK